MPGPEADDHWGQYPEMQEYLSQAGQVQSTAVQQDGQDIQYVESDGLQGQASYHYMAVPTADGPQAGVQYSDVPGQSSSYVQGTGNAQGVLHYSDIQSHAAQLSGQDGAQNSTYYNVQAQGPQGAHGDAQALQGYNQTQGDLQTHGVQAQGGQTTTQGQEALHNYTDGSNGQGAPGYHDGNLQGNPGYHDVNGQSAPPYDAQGQGSWGDGFAQAQGGVQTAPYAPDVAGAQSQAIGFGTTTVNPSGGLTVLGVSDSSAALIAVSAVGGASVPAAAAAAVGIAAASLSDDSSSTRSRRQLPGPRLLQKQKK